MVGRLVRTEIQPQQHCCTVPGTILDDRPPKNKNDRHLLLLFLLQSVHMDVSQSVFYFTSARSKVILDKGPVDVSQSISVFFLRLLAAR